MRVSPSFATLTVFEAPDYAKCARPVELRIHSGMPDMQVSQWCHLPTRQIMQCGRGRLELKFVSYWEWAKLTATAFLISICTTSIAFVLWWWLIK